MGFWAFIGARLSRPNIVAGGDVVGRDKIVVQGKAIDRPLPGLSDTPAMKRAALRLQGMATFREDGTLMTVIDELGQTHYLADGSVNYHIGDDLPIDLQNPKGLSVEEDVGMMRAAGETRKGDWMEVWTGTRFYPLDARPEEVFIVDIAHHLARINRYNGACKWEHYSVAEHCVKMAIWVYAHTGNAMLALEALMHDACEAYIGDMVRPLKRNMPEFVEAEARLWVDAIAPRFGLPQTLSPLIKECDNRILVDERAQVMAPSANPWGIDHLEPLGVKLEGWSPDLAEEHFLTQFNLLWELVETT